MSEDVLWSVIVGMSYNKLYLIDHENNNYDSSETSEEFNFINLCYECKELFSDVLIEIKKIESNISFETSLVYPLLRYSSLYFSLKNDIKFITKNNLIYKRRKDLEEYKINCILAKTGISILKSRELWCNLNHNIVKYITKNLDRSKIFFRKIGHTLLYSSFDIFLLMNYYVFENKSFQAFLSLEEIVKIKDKVDKIFNIIKNIKESISNVSKKGNLLIFNLKDDFYKNKISYIKFSYNLISFYKYRKYSNFKYIVMIGKYEEDKILVCGYNINFGDNKLNGCKIFHKNDFYNNINKIE
ncbi:ribosomal protein l24e [Vairimorpha apis BRL 01]|uniref:Ribosomal protein l24e n=1 Tax=Vairimorpha apis BRL 01 TaxID=1037528 RepID=T0MGF7_9MICR|nr:ribosomal protein l24e [Vairimorpha apis BRL 01]